MSNTKRFDRPVRIGLGGPVGSGKTMLSLRLCEAEDGSPQLRSKRARAFSVAERVQHACMHRD